MVLKMRGTVSRLCARTSGRAPKTSASSSGTALKSGISSSTPVPGLRACTWRTVSAYSQAPPSGRSSRATPVTVEYRRPMVRTDSATRRGSSASKAAGLPVSIWQKSHRRVHRSPPIRNAATPIEKKPEWIRTRATMGPAYTELKQLVHGGGLHTVCEEAGCPNIFECWEDREATFLIGGDRCTRRCDFCQIDTGKPAAFDADEPRRVAESVRTMGLRYSTVTGVARDARDGGVPQAHGAHGLRDPAGLVCVEGRR